MPHGNHLNDLITRGDALRAAVTARRIMSRTCPVGSTEAQIVEDALQYVVEALTITSPAKTTSRIARAISSLRRLHRIA